MLAFEIEINGEKYVTAGVKDWSILNVIISASQAEEGDAIENDYIRCSIGGLTLPNEDKIRHHFRWPEASLDIGSIVKIKVVETSNVDAPKKRYQSDSKIQESPFTDEELQELKYQDYLSLKREFEPDINE